MGLKLADHLNKFLELVSIDTFAQFDLPEYNAHLLSQPDESADQMLQLWGDPPDIRVQMIKLLKTPMLENKQSLLHLLKVLAFSPLEKIQQQTNGMGRERPKRLADMESTVESFGGETYPIYPGDTLKDQTKKASRSDLSRPIHSQPAMPSETDSRKVSTLPDNFSAIGSESMYSYKPSCYDPRSSSLGHISANDAEKALLRIEGGATAILRDVLYVLQGVDGQHIKFDESTFTFTVGPQVLPMNRTTRLTTCRMVLPGTHFKLLKMCLNEDSCTLIKDATGLIVDADEYVAHNNPGYELNDHRWAISTFFRIGRDKSIESTIRQLFTEAIECELARYLQFLGHLEKQLVTFENEFNLKEVTESLPAAKIAFSNTIMRRLIVLLKPGLKLLHTLHKIVSDVGRSYGTALLNTLWRYTSTGDPNTDEVGTRLFKGCAAPLFDFIRDWVICGDLSSDVHGEFFILRSHHAEATTNFFDWFRDFEIRKDRIPCFINDELADQIVSVGLMAALIRNVRGPNHFARTYDKSKQLENLSLSQIFDNTDWQQESQQPSVGKELKLQTYDEGSEFDLTQTTTFTELVRQYRYKHIKTIRTIVFEDNEFQKHLSVIHHCLLFAAGDFADALLEEAIALLLNKMSPKEITIGELQTCLAQSLKNSVVASQCAYKHLERVQCEKMSSSIQFGTSLWDYISLNYDINDSPLSVILTPPILVELRRISAFLWKIKRCCRHQHASWFSGQRNAFLLQFPEINETLLEALNVRADVLASLEKVQYYIFHEVLNVLWQELQEKIVSFKTWETIDELREIFELFILSFKQRALMEGGKNAIDLVLNDLLDLSNTTCLELDELFVAAYALVSEKLNSDAEGTMSLEEIDCRIEEDRIRFMEANVPKIEQWKAKWAECQSGLICFLDNPT